MSSDLDPDWMTLLLGKPLSLSDLTAVEQLPAARAAYDLTRVNSYPPSLGRTEQVTLREGVNGGLRAEIYIPQGLGPWPILQFMHGGGWSLGGPESVRRLAMEIAAAGRIVVNLDYRLAPEHPFPAAVEDSIFAARWTAANGQRFGADGGPIAIGGDSAGANLAAATVCALTSDLPLDELTDVGPGHPVAFGALLLLYGVFDFPLMMQEPGAMQGGVEVAFNLAYLGTHFLRHHRNPLVSPVYGDLAGFPPTYLSCGARDSLLGQSLRMTQALASAGIDTTLSVVPQVDHCFMQLDRRFPVAIKERARALEWLAEREAQARGANAV